jgi:Uma2 family endonuclease
MAVTDARDDVVEDRVVPYEEWARAVDTYGWAEVVDGVLVVRAEDEMFRDRRHDRIATRLAAAIEEQWEVPAAATPVWLMSGDEAEGLRRVREPDVLAGAGLIGDEPGEFVGTPDVVAEIWSPSNSFGDMTAKRREYHDAGLPCLVEGFVDDDGTVRLQWYVRVDGAELWRLVASAAGDHELVVTEPRPFRVVPDDLLKRVGGLIGSRAASRPGPPDAGPSGS